MVDDPVFGHLEARSKEARLSLGNMDDPVFGKFEALARPGLPETAEPRTIFEAFCRDLPLQYGRLNQFQYVKITSNTAGPSDAQRQAYLKLAENFPEVEAGIKRESYLWYFQNAIMPYLNLQTPIENYDDIVVLGLHDKDVEYMDVVPSYIDSESYINAMKYIRVDINPENKIGLFMETVNHVHWWADIEDGRLALMKLMA